MLSLLSLGWAWLFRALQELFDGIWRHPDLFTRFDRLAQSDWLSRRKQAAAVVLVVLGVAAGIVAPARAAGLTYYINNQPGSNCSDGGAHSMAQPWCTFGPANKIRTFAAGDAILLARGATWNQELSLTGRGAANEPIDLGAYGTGPKPRILRNQSSTDVCVLLMDPSHWKIHDLEVGRASVGILLHFTQLFNSGITIRDIDVHDNRGIWGGHSTEYPVSRHVIDPFASSLNINLSSGILFNVASYVTYSSSQYVLKGASLSNIRGTNNLDSVAFDAESNTLDNQDGHNAFQDVMLNGLILSNDSGHATPAFRAAGLGCSDSLRLLGMTNVTVMNSVLFNEAGCHTGTGTAAVILGRVSHVTFVNNIIFGVPASGSPDETGIDFEWSEDHVNLFSNLFADNAGPAVEILNIHGGDHSSDLNFSGNTFAENAHSQRPGAAGVWEDNKGRGYGIPAGKIRNNLYFEPHGKFFAGKNVASITEVNNLATALGANFGAEQFSAVQGHNQWHYVHETADGKWKEMPYYSPDLQNGAWVGDQGEFISAFDLAPANCIASCNSGVARAWVAPRAGKVCIRGRVLMTDGQPLTGAKAVINLVSGGNTVPLWPGNRLQTIAAYGEAGSATDVDFVHVAAGDVIRFEVHADGERTRNAVSWTPSIGYIGVDSSSSAAPLNASTAIPGALGFSGTR